MHASGQSIHTHIQIYIYIPKCLWQCQKKVLDENNLTLAKVIATLQRCKSIIYNILKAYLYADGYELIIPLYYIDFIQNQIL